MRGPELGAVVGSVGGLAFVLANAGALPGPAVWPLRGLGLVAFVAVVGLALRATRTAAETPRPDRRAWRTYLVSVAAMVAAFPLGALLLNRVLDRPALVLPWVVFVVGAHFLPFAAAFHAGIFRPLGATVMAVAVVGGLATVLVDPVASPGTGVVAGFVLLAYSLVGLVRWSTGGATPAG